MNASLGKKKRKGKKMSDQQVVDKIKELREKYLSLLRGEVDLQDQVEKLINELWLPSRSSEARVSMSKAAAGAVVVCLGDLISESLQPGWKFYPPVISSLVYARLHTIGYYFDEDHKRLLHPYPGMELLHWEIWSASAANHPDSKDAGMPTGEEADRAQSSAVLAFRKELQRRMEVAKSRAFVAASSQESAIIAILRIIVSWHASGTLLPQSRQMMLDTLGEMMAADAPRQEKGITQAQRDIACIKELVAKAIECLTC